MRLSDYPLLLQAAICALILALVGYLVAQALHFQLEAEVIFALGLAVGGFIVPLLLQRKRTHSAEASTPPTGETRTLYVGNLPYRANEAAVRELFALHGQVISVRLMKDKVTGKRRGFGFVEMPVADAERAVTALNDQEYQQRTLKVREANEKKEGEEMGS
ncbi:RNA-binding protein [Aeromonas schubertii]|uniref:RNA-binding protein n=1 Tax=Aeromonas schubertii TaxID=652 RepID=A0ABS7V913_9GAMM|nr:RNA-binding protein [Aeromonas schubertii]KUE78488.1 RNA-binding protein [Aeromonas schubertii]MBZ6065891.1 RNA-binding protein [Aeromonas schubertii]QCG49726.1 RNA-binding protein [Aeromonas schubertii]